MVVAAKNPSEVCTWLMQHTSAVCVTPLPPYQVEAPPLNWTSCVTYMYHANIVLSRWLVSTTGSSLRKACAQMVQIVNLSLVRESQSHMVESFDGNWPTRSSSEVSLVSLMEHTHILVCLCSDINMFLTFGSPCVKKRHHITSVQLAVSTNFKCPCSDINTF